ncbi:MAG: hypothetical protein R3C69_08670 [Geminicoccaceae bacterium]
MVEHAAHPDAPLSCLSDRPSLCWSRRAALVLAVTAVAGMSSGTEASDLEPPGAEVILTAKGLLGRTNVGDEARLDRQLLESFGKATLTTWTPWTEGEVEFEGLPLRSLVTGLQAGGTAMLLRALNDYHVVIPMSEARDYDLLIAWRADGVDLTRRDRGPLWVIYPWSSYPELDKRIISQRSIWQLNELEFYEE